MGAGFLLPEWFELVMGSICHDEQRQRDAGVTDGSLHLLLEELREESDDAIEGTLEEPIVDSMRSSGSLPKLTPRGNRRRSGYKV